MGKTFRNEDYNNQRDGEPRKPVKARPNRSEYRRELDMVRLGQIDPSEYMFFDHEYGEDVR